MNLNLYMLEVVFFPEIHWYNVVGVIGTEICLINFFFQSRILLLVYISCWIVWYYFSPIKVVIDK